MIGRPDCIRSPCRIRCKEIGSRNFKGIATGYLRESSQMDRNLHRAGSVAVQDEEYDFALICVVHCRCDDVIDGSRGFGFALRGLNFGLKDAAVSMLGNEFEGMKDRLAPGCSARFRKNGPDDV